MIKLLEMRRNSGEESSHYERVAVIRVNALERKDP